MTLTKEEALSISKEDFKKLRFENPKKYNAIKTMRCYYLNQEYYLRKRELMKEYVAKNREQINERCKRNYHLKKKQKAKTLTETLPEQETTN